MASGNNIQIVGNLTRDPETRMFDSGSSITSFGLAYNHRKFNKQENDWDEEVHFFDVVCWGDLGAHVANSLSKGTRVLVEGRLAHRTWENDEGEKRSKVEIVADEVAPSLRWATATVTKVEKGASSSAAPAASASVADTSEEEPF